MPSGSKKRKSAKKKKEFEGETFPNVAENQQGLASAQEQEAVAPKDELADVNKSADKKESESEVAHEPAESEMLFADTRTFVDGFIHGGTKVTEQLVVEDSGIDQGTRESSLDVNHQGNSGTDHELSNNADGVMNLKLKNAELEEMKSALTKILEGLEEAHKGTSLLQKVLDIIIS